MRILITGASGVIGGYIFKRFERQGWDVKGLDLVASPGVDLVDVSDRDQLKNYCLSHGIHRVIHCAGMMDVLGVRDPRELVNANVLGLTNLCSIMRDVAEGQIIFISSRGVYPWIAAGEIPAKFSETEPPEVDVQRSIYDLTKYTMEMIAWRYARQYGQRVTALRLASTFGLGKSSERHGHQVVLNEMFQAARSGAPFHLKGSEQHTDFVYYGDVWRACCATLRNSAQAPLVMNVSGGVRRIGDYLDALSQLFDNSKLRSSPGTDYLDSGGFGYVNLDPSLAVTSVGYAASYSPYDAFEEMHRLIQNHPHPYTIDVDGAHHSPSGEKDPRV